MSFKDFDQEGPGSFSWDYVLGGNATGLFPEETHYVLSNNILTEVTFSHSGGGTLKPSSYGLSFTVDNISSLAVDSDGNQYITFEQDGNSFKGILNRKFKQRKDEVVLDVTQI